MYTLKLAESYYGSVVVVRRVEAPGESCEDVTLAVFISILRIGRLVWGDWSGHVSVYDSLMGLNGEISTYVLTSLLLTIMFY